MTEPNIHRSQESGIIKTTHSHLYGRGAPGEPSHPRAIPRGAPRHAPLRSRCGYFRCRSPSIAIHVPEPG